MLNINAELAEFAKNLWDNYIKPQTEKEFRNTLSYYRAVVTANSNDGYLTVQQPFDNEVTVRCTEALNDTEVGSTVTVLCFGKDIPNNQIAFLLGTKTNISQGEGGGGSDSSNMVAYPFNTTAGSTYNIGDYCTKDGKLYIAVAQTTSGSWVEAHWSETRVSEHMENADIHVTLSEKTYWNNKVSAVYGSSETLFLET